MFCAVGRESSGESRTGQEEREPRLRRLGKGHISFGRFAFSHPTWVGTKNSHKREFP